MKDLLDRFSFFVEATSRTDQNRIADILREIATDQGVYLNIEEDSTDRPHTLRLRVSEPDHYTALMDAFDERAAQMKTDHEIAYKRNLIRRAERLGAKLPDHVYEQYGVEPGMNATAPNSTPISDEEHIDRNHVDWTHDYS